MAEKEKLTNSMEIVQLKDVLLQLNSLRSRVLQRIREEEGLVRQRIEELTSASVLEDVPRNPRKR